VGVPIAYNITQFSANDNLASATTIVTFNATTFGMLVPVTIDTWIMWDAEGKITQYDAVFRRFEYLVDYLIGSVATKINATSSEQAVGYVSDLLAKTICATHEEYCTGANEQYSDSKACYEFLTGGVRFGKSYELGRNTLLCREVHEHMVQYRPDVHCAHIGPNGGGYCVDDMSYTETVLQGYFNSSWIPFGFEGN
jgi:predicted transcriptional regulator of viral defense system